MTTTSLEMLPGTSYLSSNIYQKADFKKTQAIARLPNDNANSIKKVREIFLRSTENNCIQELDILINSKNLWMLGPELFSKGLNLSLEKNFAKSTGYAKIKNIIITFASKEPRHTFKYYFLCDAFRYALQHHYTRLIEASINFIHPEELIDCLKKENLIRAERLETNKNFLFITKIFLDKSSLTKLCEFLYALADKNYIKQAETIINSTYILHSTNYGKAFVQALQLDIIQLFTKSKRFDTIRSEDLDEALQSPYSHIQEMIKNTNRIKNLNITDL